MPFALSVQAILVGSYQIDFKPFGKYITVLLLPRSLLSFAIAILSPFTGLNPHLCTPYINQSSVMTTRIEPEVDDVGG